MRFLFRCIIFVVLFSALLGAFFWQYVLVWQYGKPYHPTGDMVELEIQQGTDAIGIARSMARQKLIPNEWSFLVGSWWDGMLSDMQAGKYRINTQLSPRDIAYLLTQKNAGVEEVKITFPEGWTARKMADRLTEKKLPGKMFLDFVEKPSRDVISAYDFLDDFPEDASLEGYLFPDTYVFYADSDAEDIVRKMLDTFQNRTRGDIAETIQKNKISFRQAVIMASIIESEVRTSSDRRIVSGIFWKRIEEGMRLQSDATLEYVLQTNAVQHSGKDLDTPSLYNTYMYEGLPPGPVSNPSLDSLFAAVFPEKSEFYYFLSSPKTGETFFAKTNEEQSANKIKVGL